MGKITYVLKSGDEYLRIPFKGGGSIHTTSNILDCTHFKSPVHASGFLKSVFTLPDDFMIDSEVNFRNVIIVKIALNVTEEPIDLD
ncbi:hypothetical protein [Domibacillus iocasae]|uniref:Uncharacterized protein n=1 Tax=Domibacillus iocasae TaxID=1714016 RepID=A0A1E7DRB7_9BACI|nr:hypothetical protein [Domibacillus iocasae]OES45630.1 hypothetical protein BA724_02125 [Domibacillus iocasae]